MRHEKHIQVLPTVHAAVVGLAPCYPVSGCLLPASVNHAPPLKGMMFQTVGSTRPVIHARKKTCFITTKRKKYSSTPVTTVVIKSRRIKAHKEKKKHTWYPIRRKEGKEDSRGDKTKGGCVRGGTALSGVSNYITYRYTQICRETAFSPLDRRQFCLGMS